VIEQSGRRLPGHRLRETRVMRPGPVVSHTMSVEGLRGGSARSITGCLGAAASESTKDLRCPAITAWSPGAPPAKSGRQHPMTDHMNGDALPIVERSFLGFELHWSNGVERTRMRGQW
jgi:hypothetical protein